MKLFGKALFNFKKPAGTMYDFAKHGILNNNSFAGAQLWTETAPQDPHMPQDIQPPEKSKKTPKQLFKLRTLNDNKFAIRNGNLYLDY